MDGEGLQHMEKLKKTKSPIFVILCVLCFQRQNFKCQASFY